MMPKIMRQEGELTGGEMGDYRKRYTGCPRNNIHIFVLDIKEEFLLPT